MTEKKPEIQIKEILDKSIYMNADDQYEKDATMSRTARMLRKAYTEFLKQHLEEVQFVRSKDIACKVFQGIEREDFIRE